jgi:hypothetical protein
LAMEDKRSALFKYDADPYDNDLRDKSPCCSLPDPDFWSNTVPVWALCGPYHRAKLEPGDMIFFIPKIDAIRKAGLKDHIFSGVLVVGEKLLEVDEVARHRFLREDYTRHYRRDLRAHLEDDRKRNRERTRSLRSTNFIVGDKRHSFWLGRNGPNVRQVLKSLGLHRQLSKLGSGRNNSIPRLTAEESTRLWNRLRESITAR